MWMVQNQILNDLKKFTCIERNGVIESRHFFLYAIEAMLNMLYNKKRFIAERWS